MCRSCVCVCVSALHNIPSACFLLLHQHRSTNKTCCCSLQMHFWLRCNLIHIITNWHCKVMFKSIDLFLSAVIVSSVASQAHTHTRLRADYYIFLTCYNCTPLFASYLFFFYFFSVELKNNFVLWNKSRFYRWMRLFLFLFIYIVLHCFHVHFRMLLVATRTNWERVYGSQAINNNGLFILFTFIFLNLNNRIVFWIERWDCFAMNVRSVWDLRSLWPCVWWTVQLRSY